MDGTDIRVTTPRILPFSSIGGVERRICQVLRLNDGALLALQATCVAGDLPSVTVFAALRPAGGDWQAAVALAMDFATPAALSMTVAPVVVDGGADFAVAWAFDAAGLLILSPAGAEVIEAPAPITALCAADGALFAATGAQVHRRTGQGWQAHGPALTGPVTGLALFAGQVHVAMASSSAGFDLLRSAGGDWTPVMTRGAWRYGSSPRVTAMVVVGGTLYVAADGADMTHVRIGDEHPELLAVDEAGGWHLVSGQARFSPDGLRLPATAGGPGVPGCCGLTIGGIQAKGDGLQLWMLPRGEGASVLSVMTLAGSEWSALQSVALETAGVTTLVLSEGTAFVAAGGEATAASKRKSLLVAAAL